jgi:hypothetical protein
MDCLPKRSAGRAGLRSLPGVRVICHNSAITPSDLIVRNSVIEHVGSWADIEAAAKEAQRVGRSGWVHHRLLWRGPHPTRATSSRNCRRHLGTPSDAKSDWAATSSRIRRRHHPGFVGDITPDQQSADPRRSLKASLRNRWQAPSRPWGARDTTARPGRVKNVARTDLRTLGSPQQRFD